MTKNTVDDLRNHMMAQMERLSDPDLSEDELIRECERTRAMVKISQQVLSNAALVLKAHEAIRDDKLSEDVPKGLLHHGTW